MNPYHQYQKTQATTISQEKLMLLLYEGAIKFLGQARQDLEDGRLGPGKTALSKGMAIVAELQNSLDHEAGWDGSEDMSHLYSHMILELTEANLRGDLDRIDGVRGLLTGLYDAWAEAIESHQVAAPDLTEAAAGGESESMSRSIKS
ncbi:MAG: flagellar export chaperone FliS [Leptospirillia bacterium]